MAVKKHKLDEAVEVNRARAFGAAADNGRHYDPGALLKPVELEEAEELHEKIRTNIATIEEKARALDWQVELQRRATAKALEEARRVEALAPPGAGVRR
jgi:hypothetical protein